MKNLFKKRCIIGVLLLGSIVAGLGGIIVWKTSNVKRIEKKENSIVLPILIGGGDVSWENCIKEVVMKYMEENPDVEVRVEKTINIENVDYAKALLIEEAQGNFNGIVEMRNVEMYAKEHKLAKLPETLTNRMKSMEKTEGEGYSVPRYYFCRGIIYNRQIFEELDLSIPQSWDEFLMICEKLKENGISPLTIGGGDLWHLDNWCSALFSNNVTKDIPDWIELCNKGEVHWTDKEPKQMLVDFNELFRQGYVEPDYVLTTDAETIDVLTSGRAAMLCSGTWMFSQIMKIDPQFEFGWFFLPNHQTEPLIELRGEWEWAVTSSCIENGLYETAVDFLEYYYSPKIYSEVLKNMNGFSALKTDVLYDAVPVQKELMQLVREKGEIAKPSLGTAQTPEGFGNELYAEILEMAKGNQTVSQTAERLEEEWRIRFGKKEGT